MKCIDFAYGFDVRFLQYFSYNCIHAKPAPLGRLDVYMYTFLLPFNNNNNNNIYIIAYI